jgi:tetratricopeptide (TPR) repeat protein
MSFLWGRDDRSDRIYNRAEQFRQRGEWDKACGAYRKIKAGQARRFDALHALGLIRLQQGDQAEALSLLAAALDVDGPRAGALSDYGNVHGVLGNWKDALAAYERALAVQPGHVDAIAGRGRALWSLGRLDEALESYDAALRLEPERAHTHYDRAVALLALGRPAEALEAIDKTLKLIRGACPSGAGPAQAGGLDEAEVLNSQGAALRALGRASQALVSLDRALALKPNLAEAQHSRGAVLRALNRPTEALACFERLLALDPSRADAHYNRGVVLSDLNCPTQALASYDQALKLDPTFADAHNGRGVLLTELGRLEDAGLALERAIELSPSNAHYYFNLTQSKRMPRGDARLAAMQRLARGAAALDDEGRINLDFALAKAFADIGDVKQAFRHLSQGNALKRSLTPYDEAATLEAFKRMKAAFPAEVMHADPGGGDPSRLPIFIVGMPRSGTTLCEQILASHPQIFGAGESDAFTHALNGLGGLSLGAPEALSRLSSERLRQLGAGYVRRLAEMAPAALRITNKAPGNFGIVGLIHLALPSARIIHMRRDPVATCFSCFETLFAAVMPYAFDLAELGRYYRGYAALMDHWRAVAPPGAMLEVDYEGLVTDLETQARRIVAYCGLDWDPRCLDFQHTPRLVRTASARQVRQPIYSTSIDRWKQYRAFLGPLLVALGDRAA